MSINESHLILPITFVNKSARLVKVSSFAILHVPEATASLQKWYYIPCIFLFKTEVVLLHFCILPHYQSKYLQVVGVFRWTQSLQVVLQTSLTYISNLSQFPLLASLL